MIITKQKTPDEILDLLTGKSHIFIVGCGDCAAACKTGGEPEVKAMADFLKSRGRDVTGWVVPETACVSAQVKTAFAKNRDALKHSDAILVLACGSGVQCMRQNDRLSLDVFPGCESLFAALVGADGSFQEVCSACGECVLDLTAGICPVTRCSKSLKNGPCGGSTKGKCEVDRERDCAWVLIYRELERKGRLDVMKKRSAPRDYRKSMKPAPDLRVAKP
ncbi:MAG: methylenetetrahydrofolate reductase C-terminal domain-containing protein [Candidatus Omnitrophica bacterium]|nr:methylenetetrahydrofolate reductase C-terminal domain-containing protein [Candidatus Omnitrophota bacterium]MDD5574048.1 methylenetetrahydrofolate reductase C-terminal domain-containing protein [Candidatus Omnitrophota bacterium]